MKIKVALVAVYMASVGLSKGQTPQAISSISQPAPNAAALGQYGEVAVSLYTGVPSIQIPLFALSTKSNSLGISLSYHSSGIKVAQEASWVGLGWALNVGGVVTHSKLGNDDLRAAAPEQGFPYSPVLPPWTASNAYDINNRTQSEQAADATIFNRLCGRSADSQPDYFYFSFAGHSGKFVLDKVVNGAFVIRQIDGSEKLRIEAIGNGNPGWVITTDDGHKFYFENAERTKVYSYDLGEYVPNTDFTSAWYLSRVIAADGESILFSYAASESSTVMTASEQQEEYIPGDKSPSTAPDQRDRVRPTSHSHSYTNGWILTKIAYTGGEINFHTFQRADLGTREISEENSVPAMAISGFTAVSTSDNHILKSVDFTQSYFGQATASQAMPIRFQTQRLRLDGLREFGVGTQPLIHRFDYAVTAKELPVKNSSNKDYLGYFNGKNNTYLTPEQGIPSCLPKLRIQGPITSNFVDIPGADREPDDTFIQTAILKQITFPTGGYTRFEYERHRYVGQTSQLEEPGTGLRILRVASAAGIGKPEKIKHYQYLLPSGLSSGRHMSKFRYFQVFSVYLTGTNADYGKVFRSSNNEIAQGMAAQGEPYGYDVVTVLEGENGENGKTEYYYSNREETVGSPSFFLMGIPNKIPTANGLLTRQIVYKKQGASYIPQSEIQNCYFTGASDSRQVPETCTSGLANDSYTLKGAVIINGCMTGGNVNFYAAGGIRYFDIDTYWTRLLSTTERTYDQYNPASVFQTVTNRQYGMAHRQVSKLEKFLPDGVIQRTYTTHPADYTGLPTGSAVNAMATTLHLTSAPVESYTTTSRNGGAESVTAGQFNDYQFVNASATVVKPQQVSALRLEVPLLKINFSPSTPSLIKDGHYFPQSYFKYDLASGNILSTNQADNALVSYQWTQSQQLPAAIFVAASRQPPLVGTLAIGNEASYLGFESTASADASQEVDYWNAVGIHRGVNYPVGPGHTGAMAYRIGQAPANRTTPGPSRTFSPDGQTRRYRLSAWVKTESPSFLANAGHLTLSVRQGSNNAAVPNMMREITFSDTQGNWKYQEVVLDLATAWQQLGLAPGSNGERLQLIAAVSNSGQTPGNSVGFWVDDIRFEPADGQTTTYTYDEATRAHTSVSDANNQPTYYEYDGLQRLKLVRDYAGKLLKRYTYHYQVP